MMSPETFDELVDNADLYQSALRVKTYIDSYINQPRFMEEPHKMEHRMREMITGKVKLPKYAREDIALIQRKLSQKADDERL